MAGERTAVTGPDLSALKRDYGDPDAETHAARNDVALFDFSFMARARVHGRDAVRCLETFQPRPVASLAVGRIAYSLRTDAEGYVRTDLTTWRIGEDAFEVFSGDRRDIDALAAMQSPAVMVEDRSDDTAILALQGPNTPALMRDLCGDALDGIEYFAFRDVAIDGIRCTAGRLGYTGEKGVELVTRRDDAERLWARLAAVARPAGFIAIDRLRIEAGFLLFANECRLSVTPAELGMQRFCGGNDAPPRVKLVGFRASVAPEREPWRREMESRLPGTGGIAVTSACRAPGGGAIGLGFVPAAEAGPGRIAVDGADGFGRVTQARLPMYDPEKRRPRGPWR